MYKLFNKLLNYNVLIKHTKSRPVFNNTQSSRDKWRKLEYARVRIELDNFEVHTSTNTLLYVAWILK